MCKTFIRMLGAAILFLATTVSAAPLTFDFTGTVTDDAINGCGGIVACGAATGSFTFDSGAADGNANPNAGLYIATGITFTIDGIPFFSAGNGLINVNLTPNQYGVLALGGDANGITADLSILLEDLTNSAFISDALPLSPSALAALLPGGFTLFATDDTFQLMGTIDSITCSSGCNGGGTVPEPTTLLLLAAALVGLGLNRRIAIWRR